MLLSVLLLIFAQDLSHRGPTRIQQDLLKYADRQVAPVVMETVQLAVSKFENF